MIEIAAFYQFAPLPQYEGLRAPLQALCDAHRIKGIVLVAAEGINGTIAGTREAMALVLPELRAIAGLPDLRHRTAFAPTLPFGRMKVRARPEIVTLGIAVDPLAQVGAYVAPRDWNALLADPEVLVIDARNDFEVAIGSFRGAMNPRTNSFGAFPAFAREHLDASRHRKIAMFCTGGIRCEKASSHLLAGGFESVFHLEGGILNYLETVPPEESLWEGACFVFDERIAVGHGLAIADLDLCRGCRAPLPPGGREAPAFEEGVSCPRCAHMSTPERRASARERQRQMELAQAGGRRHLGPEARKGPRRRAGKPGP